MIDELEKLAKEATPGPWVGWSSYVSQADDAFIAAASPQVVLALVKVAKLALILQDGMPGLIQPRIDLSYALKDLSSLGVNDE